MLVLTRHIDESIVVYGPCRITVCDIQKLRGEGSKVKIGIEAKPNVEIWREELISTPEDIDEII